MYLGSHWPFQYIQFMLFVILHAFLFLEKISWVFYLEQSVRLLFILGDKKSRFLQTLHSCLFCCCLSRYVMKKHSVLACYAAVYLSIFTICLAGAMHAFPSGLQSAARRSVATVTRWNLLSPCHINVLPLHIIVDVSIHSSVGNILFTALVFRLLKFPNFLCHFSLVVVCLLFLYDACSS